MRKIPDNSQTDLVEKDRQAAEETIEHLTREDDPINKIPPIEPIDQSKRPPVPIVDTLKSTAYLSGRPLPIVDIEEASQPAHKQKEPGIAFFCGELGMLHFNDEGKTKFHVKTRHFTVHDKELAAKLMEATKNPANKLFVQQQ